MIEKEQPHLSSQQSETNKEKPFILRGHHTTVMKPLITGKKTVEKMVEDNIKATKNAEFAPGYAQDVLGTTPEQEQAYKAGSYNVLKEFKELPSDHPIQIVAGKNDGICNSCAVGDHCKKMTPRNGDIGLIKTFEDKAKKLGIEDMSLTTDDNGIPSMTVSKESLEKIVTNFNRVDSVKAYRYMLFKTIKDVKDKF